MGCAGSVLDHPGVDGDPVKAAAEEAKWDEVVTRTIVSAKSAGRCPGWAVEYLDKVNAAPQLNWKSAMRPFLMKSCRAGRTFSRPSRRHGHRGDLVMPARKGKTAAGIALLVDTSGSMSSRDLEKVFPEIEGFIREFPESKLDLIMFDTEIRSQTTVTREDLPIDAGKFPFHGRGGTEYIAPMAKAMRAPERPRCMIILTDGCPSNGFGKDPGIPVLWLMTGNVVAPYGKTIRMK